MNYKDKITVIIPTYNRAYCIERSIQSVITQTYTNWELIIVDDNSTDNTYEVIVPFIKKYNGIVYRKNVYSKGPAGARNFGISISTGDFIAFLDSDDEWVPNHLMDGINAMKQTRKNLFFASWYTDSSCNHIYMSEGSMKVSFKNMLSELNIKENDSDIYSFDSNFFEYMTIKRIYFYHINTMIVSKKILSKLKYSFIEELRASEDIEFISRCISIDGFCYVNKPHFIYYMGTDNLYNFIDRSEINLNKLLLDDEKIKKIIKCDLDKCKMFSLRKDYVKKINIDIDKKACIKACNIKISKKMFTIAVLVQKNDHKLFLKCMLHSIICDLKLYKIKYLILWLLGKKILPSKDLLNFN